ncbi:MAG: hypothetical protein R2867_38435 [Caldilineaceae bacterium]
MLVINLLFSTWLLSGHAFGVAWADRLNQDVEAAAVAAIPRTFSYQGVLRDAAGKLLDGQYKIRLRLYNAPTGGSALHDETFTNVIVRAGAFSVVVGDGGTPIGATVFDNAQLFLGIAVNDNGEMLPRQRLHPVPWAMQATTAQSAVSALNLSQGGGVPNLIKLGAGSISQIDFLPNNGKITNDANGLTLNGGANSRVTTSGALNVSGDLTVGGEWNSTAIYDMGDSNGGQNNRSFVPVSLRRYIVEAPDNGASPDTVPLDDAILTQLCADEDGCTFTLGMRNWDPNRPTDPKAMLASVGPARFSISPTVQGKRWWSSRNWTGGAGVSSPSDSSVVADAQDGEGTHQHVARAWDCYFTDGEFVNGTASDTKLGFGLLNWHNQYTSVNMSCVLIIED